MYFHCTTARLRKQVSNVSRSPIVPIFLSACLHLDRIGRVFDAQQLLELMVNVCSYLAPFSSFGLDLLSIGLTLLERLF